MIFFTAVNFIFLLAALLIIIGLCGAQEKQKMFNDEIVKASNANHLILSRSVRDSCQLRVNIQKVFLHVLEKDPGAYRNDIAVTRQAMREAEAELAQAQKILNGLETQESFKVAAANEENVRLHA